MRTRVVVVLTRTRPADYRVRRVVDATAVRIDRPATGETGWCAGDHDRSRRGDGAVH